LDDINVLDAVSKFSSDANVFGYPLSAPTLTLTAKLPSSSSSTASEYLLSLSESLGKGLAMVVSCPL